MLFSPVLHGSYVDDALFAAAIIITLLLFIAMALNDRKREDKK